MWAEHIRHCPQGCLRQSRAALDHVTGLGSLSFAQAGPAGGFSHVVRQLFDYHGHSCGQGQISLVFKDQRTHKYCSIFITPYALAV